MRTALKLSIAALAASALLAPTAVAADTETDPVEICYVTLHVHTYPDVIIEPPYYGAEIGDYHVHQNCVYIQK